MARIFHIKIDLLQCTYKMRVKIFEEKVPGNVGECIFDN